MLKQTFGLFNLSTITRESTIKRSTITRGDCSTQCQVFIDMIFQFKIPQISQTISNSGCIFLPGTSVCPWSHFSISSKLLIQSPLVIVDLLIVDSLVIVDRLSRPNVYFSIYFSHNSGFSRYSGQIPTDGQIHYQERRLYQ